MVDLSKQIFIAGTSLSAAAAGAIASFSVIGIPVILVNPSEALLLTQLRHQIEAGKTYMRPLLLASALCSFANAYLHRTNSTVRTWKLVAAGVCSMSLMPYTWVFMGSTNGALLEREARGGTMMDSDDLESGSAGFGLNDGNGRRAAPTKKKNDEAPTRELVQRWAMLNFVRGLIPLAGTLFAFEAL